MVARRGYILVVILLALSAAGCFRQASEPLDAIEQQSVENTAPAPDTTLPTESVEESPTVENGDTATDSNIEPTNTPIIAVTESTSIPSPTTEPTLTPEQQPQVEEEETPITEPTRITPLAPGNSAVSTSTPAPEDPQVTNTPSGLVTPTTAPEEVVDACLYIVQPGDNLFRIAINNGTNLESLRAANPQIRGDLIQPGDRLTIPNCQPAEVPAEVPSVDAPTGGATGIIHVVQSGETLSTIAQTYGTTITSIVQANNLTNPNQLSVGQQLVIPQ